MSRGLVGAAVGAGGATAYYNKDGFGDVVRAALTPAWLSGSAGSVSSSSGSNSQIDELSRMVQQLSMDVHRRSSGVTIMHGPNRGNGAVLYVAVAVTGGVIYMRLVKGWKLGDMLYVTRAGFKKSMAQVTEGLDGMGQRINNVKTFLQQQIRALSAKQDETIAVQAEMKAQLGSVAQDVEHTRGEVSQMHEAVRELESGLEDISLSQQYANRGIYILCKVVGEMMKGGPGSKASDELENYVKHPPTIGGRPVPGLEGLLHDAQHGVPEQYGSNLVRRGSMLESGFCGIKDSPARAHSQNFPPRRPGNLVY